MSFDRSDPRSKAIEQKLEPHANAILERAGRQALHLHADSVTPEHLLSSLMEDAESAAFAAVLHAFADPATICAEALAISPGVMVVASDSTLPFSPRGLAALWCARASATRSGEEQVEPRHVLRCAFAHIEEQLARSLVEAGLQIEGCGLVADLGRQDLDPAAEPLFKRFSLAAKRSLSAANRLAAAGKHASISPVDLLLGCLKTDEVLAHSVALSFSRARMALGAQTADSSPPRPRQIPPDESLLVFLEGLGRPADSLALLAHYHSGGTPELAQILERHKVGPALIENVRGAFFDPSA